MVQTQTSQRHRRRFLAPDQVARKKRVNGLEPSTFTLATSPESVEKHSKTSGFCDSDVECATPGATDGVSDGPTTTSSDLQRVIEAWKFVPVHIRAAILIMIQGGGDADDKGDRITA